MEGMSPWPGFIPVKLCLRFKAGALTFSAYPGTPIIFIFVLVCLAWGTTAKPGVQCAGVASRRTGTPGTAAEPGAYTRCDTLIRT